MDLSGFLNEWNSPEAFVTVHTSGSTGKPKEMKVEKARMLSSARITCNFLGLKKDDTALLCLPLDFIAGKMMVVRSLERGLRLTAVRPGNHPLADVPDTPESFSLVAMVPSQVYCSMQVERERGILMNCKNLIIGGGAISKDMADALATFPNAVWSTYGMTETLSHIAMRRLSGERASVWYTPFDGVNVWTDAEGCLQIDAPDVHEGILSTNDIVEMHPAGRMFKVIGRKDNVICCGGIKLQIETVEDKLRPLMKVPFCISKKADPKFGEIAVLLYVPDGLESTEEEIASAIESLDAWSRPKILARVSGIPLTGTGKIDRKAAERLIN